jgi:hypothetical protein
MAPETTLLTLRRTAEDKKRVRRPFASLINWKEVPLVTFAWTVSLACFEIHNQLLRRFDAKFVAQERRITLILPPRLAHISFGNVGADESHLGGRTEGLGGYGLLTGLDRLGVSTGGLQASTQGFECVEADLANPLPFQ